MNQASGILMIGRSNRGHRPQVKSEGKFYHLKQGVCRAAEGQDGPVGEGEFQAPNPSTVTFTGTQRIRKAKLASSLSPSSPWPRASKQLAQLCSRPGKPVSQRATAPTSLGNGVGGHACPLPAAPMEKQSSTQTIGPPPVHLDGPAGNL